MNAKRVGFFVVLALIIGIVVYFLFFYPRKESNDFDVGSSLLKTVIRGDGESVFQIKIENHKDYSREFDIFFTNLDGFAFVEQKNIFLQGGESKFINVTFSNKKNVGAGVYIGFLNIVSDDSSQRLPVILEVESDDVLFDGNVEVFPTIIKKPGDRISIEIKIFDLSFLGPSNVNIEYFIKDFDNRIIVSEEETIVVEDQISITKPINLPITIPEGNYIAGVIIRYKNSIGTATNFFNVGESPEIGGGFFDLFDEQFLLLIVIGVFVIFAIVFLIYQRLVSKDILETQKRELRKIASEIKKSKTLSKKNFPQVRNKLKKRLENKLELLEKAKASGYISAAASKKGKMRIRRLMRKL